MILTPSQKKNQNEVIVRLMEFGKTLQNGEYFLERIPKTGGSLQIVRSMNSVIESYDKSEIERYDRLVYDMTMEGLLE